MENTTTTKNTTTVRTVVLPATSTQRAQTRFIVRAYGKDGELLGERSFAREGAAHEWACGWAQRVDSDVKFWGGLGWIS